MKKKYFKYTGKPLTSIEIDKFIERIKLKPKKIYKLNNKNKFVLVK